ncbi:MULTISPECIES: DUF3891 family protein [Pontibacillus]|uniref:DUF3891 family protein n=1 Tax=Pontibacillus chungwhensis TaxID=265426 RepID=A0ABY8UWW3_9BACI|nr:MULTISPECIES: DUF3891 family protein [Pontibacillus]MCD5325585.1 DUF3891 family protein [Pontibacillus sp. HN14]WIF98166.1 DUF3891 family protein [Pontibacillus chungwhensis]
MIVVKNDDSIMMFNQHHHALVSGVMARKWNKEYKTKGGYEDEVEYAIMNHDRAWVPLDQKPRWNTEQHLPYSFIDYPEEEKVAAYQEGVNEIEKTSSYAALLCSLHYASFYHNDDTTSKSVKQFLHNESRRREAILSSLPVEPVRLYDHLDLLQFCDNLSLYCCMNSPGVKKENELSWFRSGFPQKFSFAPEGVEAEWVDSTQIRIRPFPFEDAFTLSIPFKCISPSVSGDQLLKAYHSADWQERTVTFIEG